LRRALTALLAAALTTAPTTSCRTAIDAFGNSPEAARRAADAAFAAFAFRFYNPTRDPSFERTRLLLARHALVPSRLFADTSAWSVVSPADTSRSLFVRARYDSARFVFTPAASAAYPTSVGDQRHFIRLRSLGRNDYEWYTTVDHAIGHITPAAVAAAIMTVLTGAEGRAGDAALADALGAFPRAAIHLSRLFSLDSLRTAIGDDGATAVTLGFRFRPDRAGARYPFLAAYLDRYVMPSVYRAYLTGREGAGYFDFAGRDGGVVVRLRSLGRRLAALEGPPRSMPDSLLLRADFSARYRMFRIGFTDLVADFTIERGPHDRSWAMRFRRQPAWHFPLAVDKLIRNPLRRPFQGRGIEFRLGVRDDLGPQTMSVRYTRAVVHESAIMRWLGGLGANAFAAFTGRTELEMNLFLYELFAALRDDVRALR
jgi:hypothetical protein